MPLHLMEHPEDVSVVRLPSGEEPSFDWNTGPLASLTRTADETSVVCATASVPRGARTEGPFRAVEVAGPLDFSAVGVFAEILAPLVDAGISVLGLSTFDTDWILVPADRTDDASRAWRRAGFVITPTSLSGGR
ncbi:ACT domain-containing protein [Phycicoccus sonneratiae]|uniref:ACT domain-containing protein n=1 Tax=Phycicoccus sonneratiae TaxID=2807628 RepID=A0ABS2CHU6_9MICO|nr:ACT domain-containing protein [Phycicoccus sonneraticus]MBM6399375.1 ACT domain-containing protein [Phycicoccus sonneraticus]